MKISAKEIEEMKQRTQRSVLWEFKNEIFKLRDENISFRIIQEWLSEQMVDTSMENIRRFHARNLNQKVVEPNSQKESNDPLDGIFDDLK